MCISGCFGCLRPERTCHYNHILKIYFMSLVFKTCILTDINLKYQSIKSKKLFSLNMDKKHVFLIENLIQQMQRFQTMTLRKFKSLKY